MLILPSLDRLHKPLEPAGDRSAEGARKRQRLGYRSGGRARRCNRLRALLSLGPEGGVPPVTGRNDSHQATASS
jgi:hypothetical protein